MDNLAVAEISKPNVVLEMTIRVYKFKDGNLSSELNVNIGDELFKEGVREEAVKALVNTCSKEELENVIDEIVEEAGKTNDESVAKFNSDPDNYHLHGNYHSIYPWNKQIGEKIISESPQINFVTFTK